MKWKDGNAHFGVPLAQLPLKGFPEGAKVRLRFRNNAFTVAFVRTKSESFACYVDVKDGALVPGPRIATNRRVEC